MRRKKMLILLAVITYSSLYWLRRFTVENNTFPSITHGILFDQDSNRIFPKNHQKIECATKTKHLVQKATDLSGLLLQIRGKEHWLWIEQRINQTWSHWLNAIDHPNMTSLLDHITHKKVLIIPGIVMTRFATKRSIKSGGPLGDFLMWADLLAALHVMGHNITLSDNIAEANQLLMNAIDRNGHLTNCSSMFDVIYVDIMAVTQLTYSNRKHHGCRLRVLDAYGTEPAYNDPVYSSKYGYNSPWGKLGLNTQQFLTFYPHTVDNSFLGFMVADHSCNTSRKENIAVIYGKDNRYITNYQQKYLKTIAKHITVYATMKSDDRLPDGVQNLGVLFPQKYHDLLERTKILVGLGNPMESSGALESLACGCAFFNPKFFGQRLDVLRAKIHRKPTSRKMTSQVPYLESIGEPHVYNVDITNISQVDSIMQEINVQQIKATPSVPFEFTAHGYLQRLAIFLENQDFCGMQSAPWPPLVSMSTHLGIHEESCTQVCEREGLICEPSYFKYMNSLYDTERYGVNCKYTLERADILAPSYNISSGLCIDQLKTNLYSCAGSGRVRRLCPCRTFIPHQHSLCRECI